MKKQIKKLSLNKKTISNLSASEMSRKVGGSLGWPTEMRCSPTQYYCTYTCHGKTCNRRCIP